MGFIKEPEDVDFIIQSKPLTEEEEKELNEFIENWKKKHQKEHPELMDIDI